MADLMTFPNTVEEFMEKYKIVDKEQVYTNGAELVPIFRMKQWFEHLPTADVRENIHAHWEDWSFLGWDMETHWRRRCSNCLCEREDDNEEKDTPFCPNCGAEMTGMRGEQN